MINKIIFIILILFSKVVFSDWNIEKVKIDYLISEVSKIDGHFIRNGKSHTPLEASKHLKMKLNNALNNWLTPNKDKWTAKLFVRKIASESFLSGKPYIIEFKNGKKVKAKNWLSGKLKKRFPE